MKDNNNGVLVETRVVYEMIVVMWKLVDAGQHALVIVSFVSWNFRSLERCGFFFLMEGWSTGSKGEA